MLHLTDHLGSVVAVVRGSDGALYGASEYDAYGKRSSLTSAGTVPVPEGVTLRDGFTGKEDQSADFAVPYLDFGARQYSPALRRWLVPDPLSEKYYGISPYAYCGGNPVNFVDPDGAAPIYSRDGILLGTDDEGLQGAPIIMDENQFKQGLSSDEAKRCDLGMNGLNDSNAVELFCNSYFNLSSRPDWDGYITLQEANEWYRNGNGQPLFADLSKLDMSNLLPFGEKHVNEKKVANLFVASDSINDMLVYGQITLVRYPKSYVRAYSDKYDFRMNPGQPIRNFITIIGKCFAGKGTDYEINLYSKKKIKLNFM